MDSRRVMLLVRVMLLAGVAAVMATPAVSARSHDAPPAFATERFAAVWTPVDRPVADGAARRAWVWGPAPITPGLNEPYREAPGGQRLVQYFDKGRLELTDPAGPVTAGLLVHELISGQVQEGDDTWRVLGPARIPVAGDPGDADAPTYASLAVLLGRVGTPPGEPIVRTLRSDGGAGEEAALARYGVTARATTSGTGLSIASVFDEYLTSEGLLARPDGPAIGPLFEPRGRLTGWPITEAAWARVRVGGQPRDVLVQAFQRRILTYTPDNPPGWQVEMGNVGRHYYQWRAGGDAPGAEPFLSIGR